jgi:hypothetical protein
VTGRRDHLIPSGAAAPLLSRCPVRFGVSLALCHGCGRDAGPGSDERSGRQAEDRHARGTAYRRISMGCQTGPRPPSRLRRSRTRVLERARPVVCERFSHQPGRSDLSHLPGRAPRSSAWRRRRLSPTPRRSTSPVCALRRQAQSQRASPALAGISLAGDVRGRSV